MNGVCHQLGKFLSPLATGTTLRMPGRSIVTGTTTGRTITTITASAARTIFQNLTSRKVNTGNIGMTASCVMAKSARHGFLVPAFEKAGTVSHA